MAGSRRRLVTLLLIAGLVATTACRHEEVSTLDLLERAEALQATGNHGDSIKPLQDLVMRAPQHAKARRMLAEAYLEMGEAEAALSHIGRAITAGASSHELLPTRLRALVLLERYEEVVAALADTPMAHAAPTLLIPLAQAHLGLKDLDASAAVFGQILEHGDHGEAGHTGLFEIAMLKADHAMAETHLAALPATHPATWRLEGRIALARDQAARAEGAYRRLLDREAGDHDALVGLAQAHLARKDYVTARTLLAEIRAAHPDSLDALYLLAVTAYLQADHDLALQHVRDILSLAPQHGPALRLFGLLKLRLGHYEQAVESLKDYLAGAPQDGETAKLLAALLLQQDHPWEAETVLRGMAAATGDDAMVVALRGLSQLQRGNYGAAIELLQRATGGREIELSDVLQDGVIEVGGGKIPKGGSEMDIGPLVPVEMPTALGQAEDTVRLVQRVLHGSDDSAAYMDLAARAEERGDAAEACALYARVVATEPHGPARARFQDLACEPRYGDAGSLAARTPFRGEPTAMAGPVRAGVEREMRQLLDGLRAAAGTAGIGGGPPPADTTTLSRALAARLTTEQLATFETGRQYGSGPLYRLPPELKERLKAMRDSLPAWLRRLNDQPERQTPVANAVAYDYQVDAPAPVMAAPVTGMDVDTVRVSTEPTGAFKALMDLYDGAVGFLAWTSRVVHDYRAAVLFLVTPVLLVLLFLGVDSTRRRTGSRRSERRTGPASLQKRESSSTASRETSRTSARRRGSRRRRRRYVPG